MTQVLDSSFCLQGLQSSSHGVNEVSDTYGNSQDPLGCCAMLDTELSVTLPFSLLVLLVVVNHNQYAMFVLS